MQTVDTRQLQELDTVLGSLLEKMPDMRRELHEELAAMLKSEVDASISGAGFNDSSGKVGGWQKEHVGTQGGYAAIRPIGGKEGAKTGPKGPGAITNYLERGHKIRPPSGKNKYYRPRIKVPAVKGYYFYRAASTAAEAKAIRIAETFADRLAGMIEGG